MQNPSLQRHSLSVKHSESPSHLNIILLESCLADKNWGKKFTHKHFSFENLLERVWANGSAVLCVRTAKPSTSSRVVWFRRPPTDGDYFFKPGDTHFSFAAFTARLIERCNGHITEAEMCGFCRPYDTERNSRSWHSRSSDATAWSNLHICSGHGRSCNTRCDDVGRTASGWLINGFFLTPVTQETPTISWLGSSWIARSKVTFGCPLGPLPPTCYF